LAKKIPMRMCVSCREMRPKKELTRVVRTPDGEVLIDPTGRANGRGAYLCLKTACLDKAVKSRALERALEVGISKETYEALRKDCQNAEAEQAD
jgi:predicted RNA-binding protein YlxR (DUF448 family)